MAKSSRQGRRLRKRIFIVVGLIVLAIFLVTGILVWLAASLVGSADLVRFTVSEGESRTLVLGSGLSLSEAETANLLRDPSFEPFMFRQTLTVFGGDQTTLTVSSEQASSGLYGDGFFDGATARVMTQSDSGLSLKKTSKVSHYGINRVGIFQPVNLPGDMPSKTSVLSFARLGNLSVAVGTRGLIIRDVTGQMPEIEDAGLTTDLTGVCSTKAGFLAASSLGDILFSIDAQSWDLLSEHDTAPMQAIAASEDGLFAAVGAGGKITTGSISIAGATRSSGYALVLQSSVTDDLWDIAYGLATFVAVGDNGAVLISQNGLIWQSIRIAGGASWRAVDFKDGRFALAGNGGATAISDDGHTFHVTSQQDQRDYVDLVMLSRQQMIILDQSGGFTSSNDGGETWQQSSIDTGMKSKVIALAGKDTVLSADAAGHIGLAELVAEIQLESPLKQGVYQPGDLIFLEKATVDIPGSYLDAQQIQVTDPWEIFGTGSFQRVDNTAAPDGGTAAMLLQADEAQPTKTAILSQVIDPSLFDHTTANETYRIEFWMKQSNVADRQVKIWLTGPFNPVGTTFTNVGTSWKKYSFSLVLPLWVSSPEDREIRLNIGVAGGSLWLDRISFTRADETTDRLDRSFSADIATIKPSFIRLDFLKIGSMSVRQGNWAYPLNNDTPYVTASGWMENQGGSLGAALKMVKDSHAEPWLVLDSLTSETELLNLIEYLAGPISEPYGKIRQNEDVVTPWTQQFNRILIEITDSNTVYDSDRLKADFVDLMIKTIVKSPYYSDIKNQLIFVDGMTYRDGVVLSTADYHTSDLNGPIQPNRPGAIQSTFLAYFDQIPRNPDKPAQTALELIRSAKLRPNGTNRPDMADLTELLLRDLGAGGQSILSNLALPTRTSQEWQPCWPVAARMAALCARGIPLQVGSPSDSVFAHGFSSSDQIAIVLTNLSDQSATCQLITDLSLGKAVLTKYDAAGTLLSRQTMRQNDRKITILPGGVAVIIRSLQP
jgi:hypothetical protein